ncbi:MAG: hypothetical protein HON94_03765 [Methylococcales bacterium]|jgi:hypothetical protein|nr:hypothetical protein [Methylococcales bacterium]MBT7408686.1 hypothetical protein [Methylococcales bacterium]
MKFKLSSLIILILYSAICFGGKDPLSVRLPTIQPIPGANVQWIGQQMAMNGLPTSIQAFSVGRSLSWVMQYYRDIWKAKGFGSIIEGKNGEYTTLGYKKDENYFSVQAKEYEGGVEGTLVVSSVPGGFESNKESKFPIMNGSQVVSKLEAMDNGVRSETLTITNTQSADGNARFYRSNLKRNGWIATGFNEPNGFERLLSFQKDKQAAQITIKSNILALPGKTMILINWIK